MNEKIWRVIPFQALHHRAWDDGYVVFNNLSGDTHLLDSGAIELLQALSEAPASETALAARLARQLELDADELREIPGMLADLCTLSLIEQLPC